MTRLLSFLLLAAAMGVVAVSGFTPTQAAEPETRRVKAVREVLKTKLKLDIDKKMLRAIIYEDLPAAIKEATKLTVKIDIAPGNQGVTLPSSFELKGEMTLAEALDKLCSDKSWGWYVNHAKEGDQKDGAIFLTTNSKEHGYKEGTGPATGKEVAKKDTPKSKEKTKEEPKVGDSDKDAAELLTKAKFQLNLKQPDKAKITLKEIIEKHPDSKQAADAKKLLEKLEK